MLPHAGFFHGLRSMPEMPHCKLVGVDEL